MLLGPFSFSAIEILIKGDQITSCRSYLLNNLVLPNVFSYKAKKATVPAKQTF